MEVELQQQFAWVEQEPLYQIYLDLRKAYNALDRERCLKILAGYGVGPNHFVCRNSSGPKRRWSVVLGAVMVSPSEPFEASRRGDHSPASCSMYASTVS